MRPNKQGTLQVFVESRYVNVDGGRPLKDHEIAGMLIAVLFAGQHTSSITSSWTGYFMLTHKVSLHADRLRPPQSYCQSCLVVRG